MFSLELARQLDGTGVAINCLCPGFNVTGLGRELGFAHPLTGLLTWIGIGNPKRGAGGIVTLATDPAFGKQTGAYVSAKRARLLTPIAPADNEEARRQLWEKTAETLSQFH